MRLPIILVQNPPASGAALAESLVGNLIGRAGLDLTLVDRFDTLTAESTDRMTLEGITVPSAILDWRSEPEIMQVLAAIGFHGIRCPHQLDPTDQLPASGHSNRRLFLFDLNRHRSAERIVAELDRLRQSLSIKTVGLGLVSGKSSSMPRPAAPAPAGNDLTTPPSTTTSVLESIPVERYSQAPRVASAVMKSAVAERRSDQHLDALIDQLDGLDV